MQLDDAWESANNMVRHNLPFSDWTVRFDRARHRAGACDFTSGELIFSIPFIRHYTRWQFEQVVLHEIAHARVGPDNGHGREWKREAYKLGYDGGVTVEDLPAPPVAAWKLIGVFLVLAWWLTNHVYPMLGWLLVSIIVFIVTSSMWINYGPVPVKYRPVKRPGARL